jgi:hypothetical protein
MRREGRFSIGQAEIAMSQVLAGWHDFAMLIGAASGTLLGAMFVVVSVGTGFLTPERAAMTGIWITPTVAHVSCALFGCVLLLIPGISWAALAFVYGCSGVVGLAYGGWIFRAIWRRQTDISDRIWHALAPPVAYATMAA